MNKFTYKIKSRWQLGNFDVFKTLLELDDEHQESDEIWIDLNGMKDLRPFNMLLIARKLYNFRSKYLNKKFGFLRESVDDYLGHMAFYNAMGSDEYGKKMGEAKGSNTYLPITNINFSNLDFYENIVTIVDKLVRVFQFDIGLADFMQYALIETIRNVYEHSQSNQAFVCAQRWPSQNLVEIAVVDEGCGVEKAMKRFSKDLNEYELLELSLSPGISAKSNHSYLDKDDVWRNSGYGLYILKELCRTYKGYFIICSNNYALAFNYVGKKLHKTSFKGTAVCLSFSTDMKINFEKERSRIVDEGEILAKENKNAIKSASKSSGGNYGQT